MGVKEKQLKTIAGYFYTWVTGWMFEKNKSDACDCQHLPVFAGRREKRPTTLAPWCSQYLAFTFVFKKTQTSLKCIVTNPQLKHQVERLWWA